MQFVDSTNSYEGDNHPQDNFSYSDRPTNKRPVIDVEQMDDSCSASQKSEAAGQKRPEIDVEQMDDSFSASQKDSEASRRKKPMI